jgi:Kef-type K+ transport system membrane component KefB
MELHGHYDTLIAALGTRSALIVGVGMVPRGEVGIIIASLGKQAGVITDALYATIIAMSLLTSVVAPPALTVLARANVESRARRGRRQWQAGRVSATNLTHRDFYHYPTRHTL